MGIAICRSYYMCSIFFTTCRLGNKVIPVSSRTFGVSDSKDINITSHVPVVLFNASATCHTPVISTRHEDNLTVWTRRIKRFCLTVLFNYGKREINRSVKRCSPRLPEPLCISELFSRARKDNRNETATWPHVYQMGPPIMGGIQCDGGITGGVPIT